jgi:hypothetical protein
MGPNKNLRATVRGVNPSTRPLGMGPNTDQLSKTLQNSFINTLNSSNTIFTYPHPPTTFLGLKNANINYDISKGKKITPPLLTEVGPYSARFPYQTL